MTSPRYPQTIVTLLLAGLLSLAATTTFAQTEDLPTKTPVYQAMGAPSDPKVDVRWNRYHDCVSITRVLKELAQKFPEHAKLHSLGKSYGGRQMWVLTITDFAKGDPAAKPGFFVGGGIHANELQCSDAALYIAWYLLEMKDRNPKIARLIKDRTFYVMPSQSPDARDAHMHKPNSVNTPRSGMRPVDDDRDGLVNEDGPDDLDGDGNITQMRIRDPHGDMKPHPEFPNYLIPCKPGEKGSYRLLGTEGYDNDQDGRINEDAPGRYDPNRDWPHHWQPSYIQRGAHHYPLSILENRMIADFITAHPNIVAGQSFHNSGGMVMYGPFSPGHRFEKADTAVYHALAEKGTLMMPGYRESVCNKNLYGIHGGEVEWMHDMRGIFTFSIEMFTYAKYFHHKRGEKVRDYAGHKEIQHAFNKYLLSGQGTIDWHEVDHPQYGKVEVGGLSKNWGRQPPAFMLEEECHRTMAFVCYHAEQMPRVEIDSIDVKTLDGGLKQVTATILNRGLIPTHSATDVKHKITAPDLVTLRSPDKNLKVSLGLYTSDPTFRAPTEQRRNPAEIRLDTIPGNSATYVRWYVTGNGPFTVQCTSIKGGTHKLSQKDASL